MDSYEGFRFGADPETFNMASPDFECLHDVVFIVRNSGSREVATEKLSRFINLLSQNGFDISEEE